MSPIIIYNFLGDDPYFLTSLVLWPRHIFLKKGQENENHPHLLLCPELND